MLFVIGLILILGAMNTETDPITGEVAASSSSSVGNAVSFALWLAVACLVAIFGFTIWVIIQNPKKFIPSAIGLAVFAIIAFIGYSMAGTSPIKAVPDATEQALKMSGAGINTTGILVFIAIALILVGSVMGAMRYFSK